MVSFSFHGDTAFTGLPQGQSLSHRGMRSQPTYKGAPLRAPTTPRSTAFPKFITRTSKFVIRISLRRTFREPCRRLDRLFPLPSRSLPGPSSTSRCSRAPHTPPGLCRRCHPDSHHNQPVRHRCSAPCRCDARPWRNYPHPRSRCPHRRPVLCRCSTRSIHAAPAAVHSPARLVPSLPTPLRLLARAPGCCNQQSHPQRLQR